MLVVDASFALPACRVENGFARFVEPLVAPPFMWSEARSSLHETLWRGEIETQVANDILERLERCPVKPTTYQNLGRDAWAIADELGWAKTYDAEYLALARHLGGRVVTLDARFKRGADRTGIVVAPSEL
ncbi:MAG: type II toxin-antitoxin system VapC family toxin [Gaiellaceae bacterium]